MEPMSLVIAFLTVWFILLVICDNFMHIDESTLRLGESTSAAQGVHFLCAQLNHGAAYIHTKRFLKVEIRNHNLKDDVGYTFSLESRLLGNSSISSGPSHTYPNCVLNAYGVLCHQRLFDTE